MQEILRDSDMELSSLTLTASDFENCRINSKEIRYQGEMYDLKSVVYTDDKVNLIVIHDEKEEHLLEKIKKLAESDNQKKNKDPEHLMELLTLVYIAADLHADVSPITPIIKYNTFFREDPLSNPREIIIPPPKIS